jgi:nucleoside-triphosphatase
MKSSLLSLCWHLEVRGLPASLALTSFFPGTYILLEKLLTLTCGSYKRSLGAAKGRKRGFSQMLGSRSDFGEERREPKRIWLITGEPGAGKTTALSSILLKIRSAGYTVGGMLTREIRARGERIGFSIVDLSTEETATLATIENIPGPRVGKYRVNLKGLSEIAARAFSHASEKSDVIACDEVGPMELFSPEFRRIIVECVIGSTKPSICVVHKRLSDPLIDQLKSAGQSTTYEVTFENRVRLPSTIAEEVLESLRNQAKLHQS